MINQPNDNWNSTKATVRCRGEERDVSLLWCVMCHVHITHVHSQKNETLMCPYVFKNFTSCIRCSNSRLEKVKCFSSRHHNIVVSLNHNPVLDLKPQNCSFWQVLAMCKYIIYTFSLCSLHMIFVFISPLHLNKHLNECLFKWFSNDVWIVGGSLLFPRVKYHDGVVPLCPAPGVNCCVVFWKPVHLVRAISLGSFKVGSRSAMRPERVKNRALCAANERRFAQVASCP